MNKKERVMATFAGLEPDRTPTGFWMHFPKEYYYGDAAVKKHLEYFEKTQTDICKVMTEYMYPCDHRIKAAADWQTVQSYNRDADFIRGQADIIKRVADIGVDGSLAATIHGVVASASHTLLGFANYDGIGRYAQLFHLRTNPEAVSSAYRRIADTLCVLAQEAVHAGAEGIYYAALGGEGDGFTDEEHARYIGPLDRQVIEAAYAAGAKYVILHICKPKVRLTRFTDYRADAVNWGVEESGVPLSEGRRLFPDKVLLGGLNHHEGCLFQDNYDILEKEVHALIDQVGKKKLIVGSDCTLPGTMPYERIASVAKACASYSG